MNTFSVPFEQEKQRDAASPDQLVLDPHAVLSGKGSSNGDESYANCNMIKMGGIDDQYLSQEQAEFPRTSHGFRPKALQKIASPEQDPPTAAKANNMGLGLNNFLEYKDSDYKKV